MFIETLFIIIKDWNWSTCPSTEECAVFDNATKYYLAKKRKKGFELLIHVTWWVNLHCIMPRGNNQIQQHRTTESMHMTFRKEKLE